MNRPTWSTIVLLTALGTTGLLYLPNLQGGFMLDDRYNLIENAATHLHTLQPDRWLNAALSSNSGPLRRPLAMLSFALSHYLGGLDPAHYKLFNLLLHLACGLLIWLLVRGLLGRLGTATAARFAATATAALWLVHPIHLSVVLYAVQRMTGLSALFCLLGMLCYLHGRQRWEQGREGGTWRVVGAFVICTPLAMFSKENGALLPLYLLLIELFFFQHSAPGRTRQLQMLYAGTVLLPAILGMIWLGLHWDGLHANTYRSYDYGPGTRLLTETRILWEYLRIILLPDISWFTLFHDSPTVSRGWLSPWTTLPAALGMVVLAALPVLLRRRAPVAGFGIALFLGGHLLESTVLPLELMFEHRNYLPALGPLMALCYYLTHPRLSPSTLAWCRAALLIVALCYALISWPRAQTWGQGFPKSYVYELQNNPDSYRLHTALGAEQGRIALHTAAGDQRDQHYQSAVRHLERCANLAPDPAGCLLIQHRINRQLGYLMQPILLERAQQQMRTAWVEPETVREILRWLRLCELQTTTDCPASREQLDMLLDILTYKRYHSKAAKIRILLPLAGYYTFGNPWPEQAWRILRELRQLSTTPHAALPVRLELIYFLLRSDLGGLAEEEWDAFALGHPLYMWGYQARYVRGLFPSQATIQD